MHQKNVEVRNKKNVIGLSYYYSNVGFKELILVEFYMNRGFTYVKI